MKLLMILSDWLVTSKMIKNLFTAFYVDENILDFNEDSGNVVFTSKENGILNIDLNNINHGNNFYKDDTDTIILIRLLVWHIKFKKDKTLKKVK